MRKIERVERKLTSVACTKNRPERNSRERRQRRQRARAGKS
jgi:hypothetical protein